MDRSDALNGNEESVEAKGAHDRALDEVHQIEERMRNGKLPANRNEMREFVFDLEKLAANGKLKTDEKGKYVYEIQGGPALKPIDLHLNPRGIPIHIVRLGFGDAEKNVGQIKFTLDKNTKSGSVFLKNVENMSLVGQGFGRERPTEFVSFEVTRSNEVIAEAKNPLKYFVSKVLTGWTGSTIQINLNEVDEGGLKGDGQSREASI